jgi:hypothetical protein
MRIGYSAAADPNCFPVCADSRAALENARL